MTNKVTIADVAKTAGVSRATAARAFSAPDKLKKGTLQQVLATAEALDFRPNKLASVLRTNKSYTFGVLLPTMDNPIFAEQLQALENEMRQVGYMLIVATTDYLPEREQQSINELLSRQVDGLILTVADAKNNKVLEQLDKEKTPYVLVYNDSAEQRPCVSVDNYQAMYDATQYLLRLGHVRIAVAAGPKWQSDRAIRRYAGYVQAMEDANLTAAPLLEMPSHTTADINVLEPYLNHKIPLTAVLCSNDLLALSLMSTLQQAAYQVPQMISVIGFDGIQLGHFSNPQLTTVVQPMQEMATQAIHYLLAQMTDDNVKISKSKHRIRYGGSVSQAPVSRFFTHTLKE